MTHAPETGAENRLHFSGAGFCTCVMQICDRIHLVQKPVPNRTLFYQHFSISKPETGACVTKMMVYHRLFIFVISCKQSVVIYLFVVIHCFRNLQPGLFMCQKFSFQMYMVRKTGTENQRQKMESIYGAGFWGVSWV